MNILGTGERNVGRGRVKVGMTATPEVLVLGELTELTESGFEGCCHPGGFRMLLRDSSYKIVRRYNVELGVEAGEGKWRFCEELRNSNGI